MHNQLRGSVKINAEGRGLYKFINKIHCGHIYCFKQYVRSGVFYGEIYRHDLPRVLDFAKECGVEIKYFEHETLSKKLRKYRKRIGIGIGAAVAAAAIWYFSSIVVTIDVQGNTNVSEDVIISALEELDIKQGTFISNIDFSYCENELRIMIEDISWAAIRRMGNRLVVKVTEIVEKPDMLQDRMPCNVVADRAAQITSTSVYDGQLMRIVGDYVMPGDMLISGVIEDSTGHVTKHHAIGVITGIYEETVVFSEEYILSAYVPTGNTESKKYLYLFNLKIHLFIGKNDYSSAWEELYENQLEVFGKSIPVSIVRKKLTETELVEKEYTDEELEEIIMDKIYLYEKNFLADEEILSREITPEKSGNELTYTVTYTLEGEIGQQREIFIK
ncbi:MAG: sporulation protein YqfD [Ruminococcus sp.]|nr:sporulation protein YqfD [Ruminococcus sp.]